MRMLPVLSFAASIAMSIAAPASADTGNTRSFEHEGFRYVYKVVEDGPSQHITGRRYPGSVPFSLTVRDGMVSGTSDGKSVRFSVSSAAGAFATPDRQVTMR